MTDSSIMLALQTIIQGIEEVDENSCVIDDYSVLDGSLEGAPFIIIETPDDFVSTQLTATPETVWAIPINLFVRFTNWQESLEELRDLRNSLITKMNSLTGERSAGLTTSITIDTIRSELPIAAYYDKHSTPSSESLPVFLSHKLIFEATEY